MDTSPTKGIPPTKFQKNSAQANNTTSRDSSAPYTPNFKGVFIPCMVRSGYGAIALL